VAKATKVIHPSMATTNIARYKVQHDGDDGRAYHQELIACSVF